MSIFSAQKEILSAQYSENLCYIDFKLGLLVPPKELTTPIDFGHEVKGQGSNYYRHKKILSTKYLGALVSSFFHDHYRHFKFKVDPFQYYHKLGWHTCICF